MLNKSEHYNNLLDFYESLLTEKQKRVAHMYFREDYSLSEIAEHTLSSRSAVHDSLQRVESILDSFEKELKCHQHFIERQELYVKLKLLNIETVNEIVDALIKID
ncbi:MAG TPA: DNA-binding protein [Erysipelotrichaceae bacterium]|nr:DNA-binding protein [Erysipelotrichaceae bacterium]